MDKGQRKRSGGGRSKAPARRRDRAAPGVAARAAVEGLTDEERAEAEALAAAGAPAVVERKSFEGEIEDSRRLIAAGEVVAANALRRGETVAPSQLAQLAKGKALILNLEHFARLRRLTAERPGG